MKNKPIWELSYGELLDYFLNQGMDMEQAEVLRDLEMQRRRGNGRTEVKEPAKCPISITRVREVVEWCEAMFHAYDSLKAEEVTDFIIGELTFAILLYERITGEQAPVYRKLENEKAITAYSYWDETLNARNS